MSWKFLHIHIWKPPVACSTWLSTSTIQQLDHAVADLDVCFPTRIHQVLRQRLGKHQIVVVWSQVFLLSRNGTLEDLPRALNVRRIQPQENLPMSKCKISSYSSACPSTLPLFHVSCRITARNGALTKDRLPNCGRTVTRHNRQILKSQSPKQPTA